MPFPLLLAIPAATAGLYGLYRGVKAAVDNTSAGTVSSSASSIFDKANKSLESERESCNKVLEDYGRKKLQAFNSNIPNFIGLFSQIKDVEFSEKTAIDSFDASIFTSQTFKELKEEYAMLKSSGLGLGAGLTGGAATAFGAYSGTMMLATASTGTAISSLGGAAATNATLAWLGGGSIATGGGGMAVGMAVLGGLVAGPALAIFGSVIGNKAEVELNNARSNEMAAGTYRDAVIGVIQKMQTIAKVTLLASQTFSTISGLLRHANRNMQEVIDRSGTSFKSYTPQEKSVIFGAVKTVQLLKVLIDLPILDKAGTLIPSAEKKISDIQNNIAAAAVPN